MYLFCMKSLEYFFKFLRFSFFIILLILLMGFLLPYIKNLSHFTFMHYVVLFNKNMDALIQATIPTQLGSYNITHAIALFVILILISICTNVAEKLHEKAKTRKFIMARKAFEDLSLCKKEPK